MANYIEIFNSKLDWAMPFQRTGKFPLDRSGMFDTYTDAVAYAKGDGSDSRGLGGTSYVGQLIVVFENDIVTLYKINADRTIEALTSESGVDANILDLQTKLNTETTARKAVDGQTGQTYSANTNETHISAATSLNNADVLLSKALDKEISDRKDAINALDATILGDGSNVDVTVTQTDGKISNVEVTDVILSTSYTKVEYPTISDTNVVFTPADISDTLDVAVNKLDQNISTLVQEVLNNEEVIAAALTKHNESAGFDENANYVKDTNATYISEATTLSEADTLLDIALANEVSNRENAIKSLDATLTDSTTNIGIKIVQTDGKLSSLELTQTDIASAAALATETTNRTNADSELSIRLNDEVAARKAVDGQTGQTYTKNTGATHISAATSLNNADVLLSNALDKEISDRKNAITNTINNLDSEVVHSTTNVGITIVQTDGKLSSVELTQTDIASAAALATETTNRTNADNTLTTNLNAEIAARKAVDGQTGQTYSANSSYKHISGATSLNDADIKLNNAITAETSNRINADNTLTTNLNAEIAARKAVDGQSGQTYAKNTNATHISAATSLNNADVLLSNALDKEISDRKGADSTLTTNLNAEIAARKAVDGQSGQTYAKNTNATYISAATSLNNADVLLSNAIGDLKITSVTGTELNNLGENVNEAYKLIDGNSTQHGDYIKIYKDTSLKGVTFSDQKLHFTYILSDGSEKTVDVDVSVFLTENEYGDGLQVIDHIISVGVGNGIQIDSNDKVAIKLDSSNESAFLTLGSSGLKLSGVQTAINTAVNNEASARTNADNTLTSNLNNEISARTSADTALSNRISLLETAVGEGGSVSTQISEAINKLDSSKTGDGTHVDVTVVQTDGKITSVSVAESDIASATALKVIAGQSGTTYAKNTTVKHISAATSLNDADIRLSNAITAETSNRTSAISTLTTNLNNEIAARTSADTALDNRVDALETKVGNSNVSTQITNSINALSGTTSGNGTHVDVTVVQSAGKITSVSVAESDIASAAALATETTNRTNADNTLTTNLNAEIAARKAVAGQSGTTYAKNTTVKHISAATSLNDADIRLSNAITAETNARTSAINSLSGTTSGNGAHVDVTVVQSAGKITSVSVAESDIASAAALATETTNRTNADNKIIAAVGLNSDGTFKVPTTAQTSGYTTAATSILDAIIIMDNQIEENETVAAYALTDLNDRLATTNTTLNSLIDYCAYMSGHTTSTSLTSVPTTKRLCIATISSSQTLGLNGSITDGREVHIMIKNSSTSDITITIPTTIGGKSVINMNGENLTVYGSSYAEINLASDGTSIYYRGA